MLSSYENRKCYPTKVVNSQPGKSWKACPGWRWGWGNSTKGGKFKSEAENLFICNSYTEACQFSRDMYQVSGSILDWIQNRQILRILACQHLSTSVSLTVNTPSVQGFSISPGIRLPLASWPVRKALDLDLSVLALEFLDCYLLQKAF